MKHFTITDWIFVIAVIIMLLVVCGFSFDAKANDCSGSWCAYQDLKARLDAPPAPPVVANTAAICADIEKAIADTKNARAAEALRLLAARCWAKPPAADFDSAAKVLEPIRGNSPKIMRLWLEMEKSYLDDQTRYCYKDYSGSCSYDFRQEMVVRYKALLKYNADLGLPYEAQIRYGIKINL